MAATSILLIDPEERYFQPFIDSLDHRDVSTVTWGSETSPDPAEKVDAVVAPWVPGDAQGLLDLIALKRVLRAHRLTIIASGLDLAHIEEAYGLGIDDLIAAPATPQNLLVTLLRPSHHRSSSAPAFRIVCCSTPAGDLCRRVQHARLSGPGGNGLIDRVAGRLRVATGRSQPGSAASHLDAYLLGKFHVRTAGVDVVRWPNRKAKLLLAYLLQNHLRSTNRETLMELFWPGALPDSSRNCLNVTMHAVRRMLHEADPWHSYIRYDNEAYAIEPGVEVRLDTDEVSRCWADAQVRARSCQARELIPLLQRGLSIYRGDFLEDELYDDWAGREREHYREVCISIMDRLSGVLCEVGTWENAADVCVRLLALDPCQEEVHRRLMYCYSSLGQRSRAMKQFKVCCDVLRKELAAGPSVATQDLFDAIAAGTLPVKIKRQLRVT